MRKPKGCLSFYRALCVLGLIVACATGCAASRGVRPIGAGHLAAGASLGGPIFNNLAVPVVAPLLGVFGRYGLTHRTDLDLGMMLPVGRAVGVDVGVAHLVLRPKNHRALPFVMAGARVAVYGNARAWVQGQDINTQTPLGFEPNLFEEAYVNASWNVTRQSYGFVGVDVFTQIHKNTWRPNIMAGLIWHSQGPISLQAQLNWLAIHKRTDFLSLRYLSLAHQGSIGLQLSLTYDFGRVTRRPS